MIGISLKIKRRDISLIMHCFIKLITREFQISGTRATSERRLRVDYGEYVYYSMNTIDNGRKAVHQPCIWNMSPEIKCLLISWVKSFLL